MKAPRLPGRARDRPRVHHPRFFLKHGGYVAEIKRIRPDLVFIWGGSTALAALGRFDAADLLARCATSRSCWPSSPTRSAAAWWRTWSGRAPGDRHHLRRPGGRAVVGDAGVAAVQAPGHVLQPAGTRAAPTQSARRRWRRPRSWSSCSRPSRSSPARRRATRPPKKKKKHPARHLPERQGRRPALVGRWTSVCRPFPHRNALLRFPTGSRGLSAATTTSGSLWASRLRGSITW